MALRAPVNSGGEEFRRVPPGTHVAIVRMIVDLGIQPGRGIYPQPKHELYVGFEVPEERVTYTKDGKEIEGPMAIGRTYTLSMSEKSNLRKDLQSWRGRNFTDDEAAEFDIESILGKACMITVVEKQSGDKVYSNIVGMSGLPKGVPSPKPENPLLIYTSERKGALDKLPKWLQEKIANQLPPNATSRESVEDEMAREAASRDDFEDDDIPF